MFCVNCGKKLNEKIKFCPYCGTNLSEYIESVQEELEVQNEKSDIKTEIHVQNDINIVADNVSNHNSDMKKIVEEIFYSIFRVRGAYGEHLYIVGRDNIPIDMQENASEYLAGGDADEIPLLVFNYVDTKYGFVLTDRRIVWHYDGYGWSDILYEDIKNIQKEKANLATIMSIISYDNEIYPRIYLTGLQGEDKFIIAFRKFVFEIQKVLNPADEGESDERERYVDAIIRSCNCVKLDSVYCEIGSPKISSQSHKYNNAKLYFNIPDTEDIYMIYDETILGSCKKGFALCTTGFYYCQERAGCIPWEDFKNIKVSKNFGLTSVGNMDFNTSTDCKKVVMILQSLQALL